ncbi:MAG: GNAT family N-acyltransferase [Balneolaceae bacterium]
MIAEARILPDISDRTYSIEIAKSEEEIQQALKLRYEVFYKELDRKFSENDSIDRDAYDDQCHHLIVKKNSDQSIIGTYRLQTNELASKGAGFYSEKYYRLDSLPDEVLTLGFEVGRACIDAKHRNGRVLFLLWKGFAGYLTHFNKKYLFGTLGIEEKNRAAAYAMYDKLQAEGHIHRDVQAEVREEFALKRYSEIHTNGKSALDESPLLRNYLEIGCKVVSAPAYIKELNMLHLMVLLNVDTISPKVRRMFFSES